MAEAPCELGLKELKKLLWKQCFPYKAKLRNTGEIARTPNVSGNINMFPSFASLIALSDLSSQLRFNKWIKILCRVYKELRRFILSHFSDGLNYGGLSNGEPENNGSLRKKDSTGLIPKQRGTKNGLRRIRLQPRKRQ